VKLNHLNLTVTDVAETHAFFERYFGLRTMGPGNVNMAGLTDDDGFVLVLMKAGPAGDVKYPPSFHVGFRQESEEKVNEINRRLREGGFDVTPPKTMHGAWAFYFNAPGGFTIEVAHW
jgi:lactoylglutathione lyase